MTNKKWLIPGVLIVSIIISLFIIPFPLKTINLGKENIGKYSSMLPSQYANLNQYDPFIPNFLLPDQYPFYGRLEIKNEEGDVSVVNDRMVSKCFFEYNNQSYYFYYSEYQKPINAHKRCAPFELTYPDVYKTDSDTVIFTLLENPEGYFISDNYFYYAYGKNNYCIRRIDLHNYLFRYTNVKDYRYARLNLDTYENEKISKEGYEEKYNLLSKEIYGQLPVF